MSDPTTTDQLAAQEAATRAHRERRTAITAAFRNAALTGSPVSGPLADLVRSRIDGTQLSNRQQPKHRNADTNHADHITHASTPLDREDS